MEFPQAVYHGGNHSYTVQNSELPLIVQPVSFQNGMHRPPSTNSLLNDMENQLLNAPIQSSCPDEQKLMAKIESMCNLLEPSQGQATNNMDPSDIEYSYSTINSTSSRSTGESNEKGGFVSSSQPHQRVSSFSNLFFEQTLQEYVTGVRINN